jgi:hypothetical protein
MSDNSSSSDPYSVDSLVREFRDMMLEIERNRTLINSGSTDGLLSRLMSELLNIRNGHRPQERTVMVVCTHKRTNEVRQILVEDFRSVEWSQEWTFDLTLI